jgi:hypothetical protein
VGQGNPGCQHKALAGRSPFQRYRPPARPLRAIFALKGVVSPASKPGPVNLDTTIGLVWPGKPRPVSTARLPHANP